MRLCPRLLKGPVRFFPLEIYAKESYFSISAMKKHKSKNVIGENTFNDTKEINLTNSSIPIILLFNLVTVE